MRVGNVQIGPEYPVCIVTEIGASHNGHIGYAKDLIDAAHASGASLVKMQIYTADEMCLPGVPCPGPGPWEGQDLHELYKRAGTPWEWWPILRDYATSRGVTLFSSAFSPEAVQYLVREGCPAIKIASHEIGWLEKLTAQWSHRRVQLIVSACTRAEIERIGGSVADAVLWCPAGYPAASLDPADMGWLAGLCAGVELGSRLDGGGCLGPMFGLSDNGGPSHRAASWSAAIRAGASMIEAHLKLDGTRTEDDAFSMTPDELQHLVRFSRECPRRPPDVPSPYRRSVWLTKPVKRGESVVEHVRMLRPFGHIEPRMWGPRGSQGGSVVGPWVAARDLEPGPLRWEDVE